ncbi:insulinase family protein [bacterium]|nr:insulinase family protein [bacterium]
MKIRSIALMTAAGALIATGCARRSGVETVVLENGLRVVITNIPSPVAAAVVWMDYGERDGGPGVSRAVNRMLLGGTEIRNRNQIFREIESAGGWIGVETGLTGSIMVLQAPAEEFTACFAILAECLSRSTFDSTELAAAGGFEEGGAGFAKILRRKYRKDSAIRSVLFPDSPAGAAGAKKTRSVTADSVAAFAARHVRPERMIVSIAGECDCKAVLKTLNEAWRGRRAPEPFPAFESGAAAPGPVPGTVRASRSAGRNRRDSLVVALRTSVPYGPDFLVEYLAGLALSAKQDGLLARAASGGAASAAGLELDFYFQNEADFGYWVASAVPSAGRGPEAKRRLEELLAEAQTNGISEPVFTTARRRLESAFAIRSQYTLNHAYFGALAERLNLPYRSIFDIQKAAASVTHEQLNGRLGDILPRMRVIISSGAGR